MINFENCKNIFIDFDGVIVDSNEFKEKAIEESISKLFGNHKKSIEAIDYFNINAGLSRNYKLSKFYNKNQVSQIMKLYGQKCKNFFLKANPTLGFEKFVKYINKNHKNIKIFVLSGGEETEIISFLRRHYLLKYFEEILASKKSKLLHLKNKQVATNDIFIGDSHNDLMASLSVGMKFILIEEYKSLKSYPKEDLIKHNGFLKIKNFESIMKKLSDE